MFYNNDINENYLPVCDSGCCNGTDKGLKRFCQVQDPALECIETACTYGCARGECCEITCI